VVVERTERHPKYFVDVGANGLITDLNDTPASFTAARRWLVTVCGCGRNDENPNRTHGHGGEERTASTIVSATSNPEAGSICQRAPARLAALRFLMTTERQCQGAFDCLNGAKPGHSCLPKDQNNEA
jgi:hypothetical protein